MFDNTKGNNFLIACRKIGLMTIDLKKDTEEPVDILLNKISLPVTVSEIYAGHCICKNRIIYCI